jgi:hypothetical protein
VSLREIFRDARRQQQPFWNKGMRNKGKEKTTGIEWMCSSKTEE